MGTPVSYAYAVKAGPWIFLNGHEAFDFESGIPEEVTGPAAFPLFGRPRSRREGDFILRRMRRILREFGSDLSRGLRPFATPDRETRNATLRSRHRAAVDWARNREMQRLSRESGRSHPRLTSP